MRAIESFALHRYQKVMYDVADGKFTDKEVTRLEYYSQLLADEQLTEYLWYDFHHDDKAHPRDESIEKAVALLREQAFTAGFSDKQAFDFFRTSGMIVAQIDPSYQEWAKDGLLVTNFVRELLPPSSWYIQGEQAIADLLWEAFVSSELGPPDGAAVTSLDQLLEISKHRYKSMNTWQPTPLVLESNRSPVDDLQLAGRKRPR